MRPDDLELCTTEQLIDELVRRQTFLGVLIHSEGDWKGHWEGERNFRVRFNGNLSAEEVGRLLGVLAERLNGAGA